MKNKTTSSNHSRQTEANVIALKTTQFGIKNALIKKFGALANPAIIGFYIEIKQFKFGKCKKTFLLTNLVSTNQFRC